MSGRVPAQHVRGPGFDPQHWTQNKTCQLWQKRIVVQRNKLGLVSRDTMYEDNLLSKSGFQNLDF